MKIGVSNKPSIPNNRFAKGHLASLRSLKVAQKSLKSEEKKKPNTMTNKKFETLNDNILQNNKKLNSLIDNYNKFMDKYESNSYKMLKPSAKLSKESKSSSEYLYKLQRTTRVAPLVLEPSQPVTVDKYKIRPRKSIEKSLRKSMYKKKSHIASSLLNNNNEQRYQHLLASNINDEEISNKNVKKQLEDIKRIEETANQQNDFLLFLMDKNLPNNTRKVDANTNNLLHQMDMLTSKMIEGQMRRSRKIKCTSDHKMKEINDFLNHNLLKNYQLLSNVANKNDSKANNPIFLPTGLFNKKI